MKNHMHFKKETTHSHMDSFNQPKSLIPGSNLLFIDFRRGFIRFRDCLVIIIILITSSIIYSDTQINGGHEDIFLGLLYPRPLSMGGTSSALSNDISGIVYNPAGITLITRKTLGFSFAKHKSVGTNIISTAFIAPLKQYGTIGFAFDRLGVGDMEERDNNGNLISTYSDNYNRFSGSYAIRIKNVISFGITSSFIYRSFYDISNKDYTINFGGQLYPFADEDYHLSGPLTLGCFMTDILEKPSMRVGLSLRYNYGHYKHFIISSDIGLFHSKKMFFVGFEFIPSSSVVIRGGLDRFDPTLGFGYNGGNIDIEYTFQYKEVHSYHTFGVSIRMGDDWVDAEKTKKFIESELQSAMYYIQTKYYEKAHEKLKNVLVLDSENARANELIKTVEVEIMIREGRNRYNEGELDKSLEIFNEVAEISPDNLRIQGYINLVEEAIRLREEERLRQEEIKELRAIGENYLERGLYWRALTQYREALKLDPDNEEIKSRIDFIIVKIGEEEVPDITRDIIISYDRGLDLIDGGNYHDGIRLLEYVYSSVGNYENTLTELTEAYFYLGMESYGNGFLQDAVGYWNRIIEKDPDNTEVLGMIERAETELEGIR